MKKINGILIFIALLSVGFLFYIANYLGLFAAKDGAAKDKDSIQNEYKEQYEEDFTTNREIVATIAENLFPARDASEIYSYAFQKKVREKIDLLIEVGNYTEDAPLMILNPFGTNTQSLYTYFETEVPCAVSYTVHTSATSSAAPDFGGYVTASTEMRTLDNGANFEVGNSRIHEFAISGLVPNQTNIITLRLTDEFGNIRIRRLYYGFGKVVSVNEEHIDVEAGQKVVSTNENGETKITNATDVTLVDGMYAVFSKENDYAPYVKLYDNDGYLRGEIPLETNFAESMYVKNGEIYLFVSDRKFVKINSLGEVKEIYDSDEYTFTGEWCVDGNGNVLAIATKNDRRNISMKDCIVTIDFTDGDIYMLVDFARLLTDYHVRCNNPDWIDITDVSYIGNNMIVVCSKKLNAVIKVRRIYNDPRLVYIAGDPGAMEGTVYTDLYLRNDGNYAFSTTAEYGGYEEYDKIREARHYLWLLDRNLDYAYGKKEAHFGYYLKYLADEEEKTLRMVETVRLPELTEKSKLVRCNDNWLFVNGEESVFYEFDDWFQLIASFRYTEPIVKKTIEQQDYEEDFPPADDSVTYVGIYKFDLYDYYFSKDIIVYKDKTDKNELLDVTE